MRKLVQEDTTLADDVNQEQSNLVTEKREAKKAV